MSNEAKSLIDYLEDVLASVDADAGKDARAVVETVLAHVIAALLRADRSIPARNRADWELFFADAANRATEDMGHGLIGREQVIFRINDAILDASRRAAGKDVATVIAFPTQRRELV